MPLTTVAISRGRMTKVRRRRLPCITSGIDAPKMGGVTLCPWENNRSPLATGSERVIGHSEKAFTDRRQVLGTISIGALILAHEPTSRTMPK